MADRYLVASGNVTWNSSNTALWSATSGGATGASVPTSADDVFIDANSGTGTIKFATVVCKSLNFTGFTGTFAHDSAGSNLTIHGGLTMVAGMTSGVTSGTFTFASTTDNGGAGWPITTNGKTLPNVTFNGVGGKWTLQDAMTCSQFMLLNGTFDTNSQDITCNSIFRTDTGTKTLTLGSSTITISAAGNTIQFYNVDPTITANTATFIILTGSGIAFQAATNMNGASLDIRTNNGGGFTVPASTWANITCTTLGAKPLAFSGNVMVTDTLTLAGTNSTTNRQHIYSSVLGTPRVITAAATSLTDVDFMDISIVGPTGSTITSDSFNRADGALGSTDAAAGGSALAWTASSGTWVIDTNKAACTTAAAGYRDVTVDVGVTDMAVEAVITPGVEIWGLTARFTDQNNRIWVQQGGASPPVVVQIAAGSQNIIFTASAAISAGDRCRLVVAGNNVVLYKNDTSIGAGVITKTLTGTRAGLTAYAYNADPARRFDDFIVKAVPGVTGTRLGDCLGNSGIEFTTASGTPRDGGGAGVKRYAVAAGNWSDTAMWSESSGGAPGASVPLPQDDVYLDANSAAGTYAVNVPRMGRNIDATGFTRTINHGAISTTAIYGSLTRGSDGTYTEVAGNIDFRGRGSHTVTMTTNVVSNLNFWSGKYTLLAGFSANGAYNNAVTLYGGTLDLNGQTLNLVNLQTSGTLTKTLIFGAATINMIGQLVNIFNLSHANSTVSAEAATINISAVFAADRNFWGGNNEFGALNYTVSDSPGALVISNSNTFGTLNIGSGRSLRLTSGTTQKIGTLNLAGVPRGGVRLPGVGGTYLSTPDSAAVSVTGDIDIRCRVALTDYTAASEGALVTKFGAAGQRSFRFFVDTAGRLNFNMSTDGTANTGLQWQAGPTFVDGTTYWVRTTRTAAGTLRFFYAADQPTMPTSWTEAGLSQTLSAGQNLFDSTSPVEIGSMTLGTAHLANGVFKRAQIRNNVLDDGSGIVFDTNFSNQFGPYYVDSANGAIVTPITTLANVGDGRVVIESVTAGSAATLQVDTVTDMNYVDLKDVVMNGADTYIGATSVIRTNVKGVRRGPKTGLGV